MLTVALGNLVRFVLVPGNRFDTIAVAPLIAGVGSTRRWPTRLSTGIGSPPTRTAQGALTCISQRLVPLIPNPEICKCC